MSDLLKEFQGWQLLIWANRYDARLLDDQGPAVGARANMEFLVYGESLDQCGRWSSIRGIEA